MRFGTRLFAVFLLAFGLMGVAACAPKSRVDNLRAKARTGDAGAQFETRHDVRQR